MPVGATDSSAHLTAPCVIIGGGLAGIAAALRMRQLGLATFVLERSEEDGGANNARISGGLMHVAWGAMDEPAEQLYERLVNATDGEIDHELARAFAENAGPVVAWLETLGVEMSPKGPVPYMKFAMAPHEAGVGRRLLSGRGPDRAMLGMYEQARRAGVDVRLGASAEALEPDSEGGWIVRYRTADGTREAVRAPTVLAADGGFQANPELLSRYVAPNAGACLLRAMTSSTGSALRALLDNGAGAVGLGRVYGHVVSVSALENDTLWPYPTLDKLCLQGLLVDRAGDRLATRATDGVQLVNELASQQDPRGYAVICDEPLWTSAGADNPYGTPVPNPDLLERGGHARAADDLQELAREMSVDPAVLATAVADHNADGGKPPIRTAPYRAIGVIAGITFTMGGVRIDPRCQVLDELGAPIDGLYAAGGCAGGLHGGPHGGYVGGLAEAAVFGYLAAEAIHDRLSAAVATQPSRTQTLQA
jgi:fumarate reductase flavoprotein subunit